MSHITRLSFAFTELEVLDRAARRFGLKLDSDLGPVEVHGYRRTTADRRLVWIDGRAGYQVGLVADEASGTYRVEADFGMPHSDGGLVAALGEAHTDADGTRVEAGWRLRQEYSLCAAEDELAREGWLSHRQTLDDGTIDLVAVRHETETETAADWQTGGSL